MIFARIIWECRQENYNKSNAKKSLLWFLALKILKIYAKIFMIKEQKMTDKELKKEKEELLSYLHDKISKVKNNSDLKEILEKVDSLNVYLDKDDSPLENLLDSVSQFFSTSLQSKIKKKINDIFDKYDKVDKKGNSFYNNIDKEKIRGLIKAINDICDRNFWDRFKVVLGMGS